MNNEIFKVDNTISEYTPIMRGDKIIGCTIGENERGRPVRCVLYPWFLSEEEMIRADDTRYVFFLETGGDECP